MAEEKKGLFKKLADALSNKDEEAAEAAAKELAESQAKAEAARDRLIKEAKTKATAEAKAAAEKAKLEAEQAKKEAEEAKAEAAKLRQLKAQEEMAKKIAAAQKVKVEAEAKKAAEEAIKAATIKHVWTNEDTYASLAFKHYGSQKTPYWRLIYEHNKHIIGDNPNSIKTGTEIEIPPLPDELKLDKK